MTQRSKIYFVSDVHLGLQLSDPHAREQRFVSFLKEINKESTKAVYLLGDIWDFWYEYRDVVPKEGIRVVAALIDLMDSGIEVYFFEGNHDIWSFRFFESLGMKKLCQPCYCTIGSKTFCMGHGDGIGGAKWSYTLMLKVFHSKVAQSLFSLLHPWLAYRLGLGWSNSNRRSHKPYVFKGESEPLYKFALANSGKADFFVFGHFHIGEDVHMPDGSRLVIVKDWMSGGSPYLLFDEQTEELTNVF